MPGDPLRLTHLARLVQGPYFAWEPQNKGQEDYWNTRYPSSALVTMMKLVAGVKMLDFSECKVPSLVVYSENDQVVNPSEVTKTFKRLGSVEKELVAFNSSADLYGHVLAGEIVSPGTIGPIRNLIVEFLQRTRP